MYGGSNPTCNTFAGQVGFAAAQSISCLNNRTNIYQGRYVTIQLQDSNAQLGLCDVSIWARPLTKPAVGGRR